jgi:hypothetical protein
VPPICDGTLVSMSRTCKTVDYDQARDLKVRLVDCLPPEHLARFVVDIVAQLDLLWWTLAVAHGWGGGQATDVTLTLVGTRSGFTNGIKIYKCQSPLTDRQRHG